MIRHRPVLAALLVCALALPAAAGQHRQQVVVLAGLPGAGKTTLAKRLAGELHAPYLTCGDVVRGWIRQQGFPYTPQTDRAASRHFARTPGEIARRLGDQIAASRRRTHIVDGVRSPADLRVLKERFEVRVVALRAPARVRYARMLARERFPGENEADYRARDRREVGLGVLHVLRRPFVRLEAGGPESDVPGQAVALARALRASFR